MSPTIWTRCGGKASLSALRATAWRVVEGQHVVATRKLVDSDAEQRLLEEMIDTAKPPVPPEPELAGLHYLLTTPFRYPPVRHGSRFGRRTERGIWYGSESRRTAFAECAYYRLLFLEGTVGVDGPVMTDMSAFTAELASSSAVDLTEGCFADYEERISAPAAYDDAQQLGSEMRRDGVELFRYRSARDDEGGHNLGVFTAAAFAHPHPSPPETWYCVTTREAVELSRRDVFEHRERSFLFPRGQFEVAGDLPSPAV